MTNSREILSRINSIKDTMKITNAMYMISSAKVKKARRDLEKTEQFFQAMKLSMSRLVNSVDDDDEIKNKYFNKREYLKTHNDRTEGYIVITADKGLAAAYNHNIVKIAEEKIKGDEKNMLFVVGEVGRRYFHKRNINIDEMFKFTAQNPSVNRARAIAEKMLELFVTKRLDEVYIIYTRLSEHGEEEAVIEQLLPLKREHLHKDESYHQTISFYPDPQSVINQIVPIYLTDFIYSALVESFCTENNARMKAMNNATNAAKKMIKELSIEYNTARQSAITQEITEIVSGANALKNN